MPGTLGRNRFVQLYLGIYAITLAAVHVLEGFPLVLPLFVLGVMGGLSRWSRRGSRGARRRRPCPCVAPGPRHSPSRST